MGRSLHSGATLEGEDQRVTFDGHLYQRTGHAVLSTNLTFNIGERLPHDEMNGLIFRAHRLYRYNTKEYKPFDNPFSG